MLKDMEHGTGIRDQKSQSHMAFRSTNQGAFLATPGFQLAMLETVH